MKRRGLKQIFRNTFKRLCFMGLCFLAGCSTYSETFECVPGPGVGCKSISEVDEMITAGKLSEEKSASALPIQLTKYKPIVHEGLSPSENSLTTSFSSISSDTVRSPVIRTSEKPLRIWIAAFEDEKGNLFEAHVVHTIVKPAQWQIKG